jgi:hypothetical protein
MIEKLREKMYNLSVCFERRNNNGYKKNKKKQEKTGKKIASFAALHHSRDRDSAYDPCCTQFKGFLLQKSRGFNHRSEQ